MYEYSLNSSVPAFMNHQHNRRKNQQHQTNCKLIIKKGFEIKNEKHFLNKCRQCQKFPILITMVHCVASTALNGVVRSLSRRSLYSAFKSANSSIQNIGKRECSCHKFVMNARCSSLCKGTLNQTGPRKIKIYIHRFA